jgi:hypothetical protein
MNDGAPWASILVPFKYINLRAIRQTKGSPRAYLSATGDGRFGSDLFEVREECHKRYISTQESLEYRHLLTHTPRTHSGAAGRETLRMNEKNPAIGLAEFMGAWAGLDAQQTKLVHTRFNTLLNTPRFRLARRTAWEAVYPKRDGEPLLLGDIAEAWTRINEVVRDKPDLAPSREAALAATIGFVVRGRLSTRRQLELLRPFRGLV